MSEKNLLLTAVVVAAIVCAVVMWSRDRPFYSTALLPRSSASSPADSGVSLSSSRTHPASEAEVSARDASPIALAEIPSVFRVVDAAAHPIAGATIVLYEELDRSVIGECDAAGMLTLDYAMPRTGVVTAVAPNRWAERIPLETATQPIIVIRMISAGTLSGTVTMPDGIPAPEGIMVIAWPSALRTPMRRTTFNGMIGDPYVRATTTESDGRFEFEALDPRTKYSLAAGGRGCLTPTPVTQIPTDEQLTRLQLSTVIGARIRLIETDGKPLLKSTELATVWAVQLRLQTEDPAVTKIPDYLVPLSGIVPPEEEFLPFTSLMFYAASDDRQSVGPILGSASLPGYMPKSYLFYAHRIPVSSGIDEQLIEIDPLVSERGHLEIQFEGDTCECWDGRRRQAIAVVHLSDSLGNKLEFELGGFAPGLHSIPEVPVGDYLLRVTSKCSAFAWPAMDLPATRVVIADGGTARVTIPTHRMGSITAAISDVHNVSYTGPAVLVLVSEEGTAGGRGRGHSLELDFDRAPYCISGLEPGSYRMAARFPLARSHLFDAGNSIAIAAGENKRVELALVAD